MSGMRCTNLRTMSGKRPVFVDDVNSVFFFPYLHIRFVEIPPAALRRADLATCPSTAAEDDVRDGLVPAGVAVDEPAEEADLEIDEDFLRRIREV